MEEKEHRRLRAVEEISKACPSIVNYVMGEDFKIGLQTILEILQNPLYNKQVGSISFINGEFYKLCYIFGSL